MSIQNNSESRGFWTNLSRLTRLRLVIPLKRGQMPPEYIARGVAVGLAIAFTPTVGVQLIAVFAIWGLSRSLPPRFHFHVVPAFAWVWVTNLFTIGPIYYGFLLTGQAMLGRFDELGSVGLHAFSARLTELVSADTGFFEGLWEGTVALFDIWGLPLFLGSIPWAIGTAWLGYFWSIRFVTRFRATRQKRLEKRPSKN
jgi:uncharacterized protein (DUF2062 family)